MKSSMRPIFSVLGLSINLLSTFHITHFWFFIAKQHPGAKMALGAGWASIAFIHIFGIILFLIGSKNKYFITMAIISETLFALLSAYLIYFV